MSIDTDIRWCPRKRFDVTRFHSYLLRSIENNHITNDGPLQSVCCAKLREFLCCEGQVVLAASGTAGLHALAVGYSLCKGRRLRWATQAFTFPSSSQGPFQDAIIVDCEPGEIGPSLRVLDTLCGAIDGVVVTNVFGLQLNVRAYEEWCLRNGKLLLLDNAATAFGMLDDGRCLHDVGHGSMISLHETKPVGRGEGGALIIPQHAVPFVHRAMNFGFDIPGNIRIGDRQCSNWRMSDIGAAAICDHLDNVIAEQWIKIQSDKLHLVLKYAESKGFRTPMGVAVPRETLASCLFLQLPESTDVDNTCSYLNHELSGGIRRVEAKRYYRPLCDRDVVPNSWKVYDKCICLPFHVSLSLHDLQLAIDKLEAACFLMSARA